MNNSYWIESTKDIELDSGKLSENIETDVCIIGSRYNRNQYSL